jgi:hypothetical protein
MPLNFNINGQKLNGFLPNHHPVPRTVCLVSLWGHFGGYDPCAIRLKSGAACKFARSVSTYVSHLNASKGDEIMSSIDMYNNDVGKESAQKFMKQTGDLKAATLYFAS